MADQLKPLFYNHLQSRSLSLTPQRARVLEEVLRSGGHFAAEDLCVRLRGGRAKVSRATVYRTLDLLLESGVVQKLRLDDDHFRFEVVRIRTHHDHMLCEACGRVIEFYSETIEDLQNEICKKAGFAPSGHSLVIQGRCDRCGDAGVPEPRRMKSRKD